MQADVRITASSGQRLSLLHSPITMRRVTSGLFACMLTLTHVQAQPFSIEWQRCLGGSRGSTPYEVVHTLDGGYIVAGSTSADDGDASGWHEGYTPLGFALPDAWVVKLSATGALEWQHTCGGSGLDGAQGIVACADGTYIVFGNTESTDGDVVGQHGNADLWVYKLSATGQLLWQRPLGGAENELLLVPAMTGTWTTLMQATADGGCVVGYNTLSSELPEYHGGQEQYVARLAADGDVLWQRCLGGTGDDALGVLRLDAQGNSFVGGLTFSADGDVAANHGGGDAWVSKLSPTGELLWSSTHGGSQGEMLYDLQLTADGGCVFTGTCGSDDGDVTGHHGNGDIWIVKLGGDGALQWQYAYGGGMLEENPRIQPALDGGWFVAAMTTSADGDVSGYHAAPGVFEFDVWVLRLNAQGELLWQRCLGGAAAEQLTGLVVLPGGGCAVSAGTWSSEGDVVGHHGGVTDAWLVELNNTGAIAAQRCLGSAGQEDMMDVLRTADDGYLYYAMVNAPGGDVDPLQFHGEADAWLVKLQRDPHLGLHTVEGEGDFQVVPIPATHGLTVTCAVAPYHITLVDALGRTVLTERRTGTEPCVIDVAALRRGAYALTLHHASGSSTQRIVLE